MPQYSRHGLLHAVVRANEILLETLHTEVATVSLLTTAYVHSKSVAINELLRSKPLFTRNHVIPGPASSDSIRQPVRALMREV
jgi:hypothetical protein